MTSLVSTAPAVYAYPRFFRIGGIWVNSYQFFLCIGLYCGILLSAVSAARSEASPLRVGVGSLVCAIVALIGARVYHVMVYLRHYRAGGFWREAWNSERGGWSVFGGLVIVPFSFTLSPIVGVPISAFWDHMALGIAFGGAWIRYGCTWNGCCVGRESQRWFAMTQHDTNLVYRRRVPAQWLEIGWWLIAGAGVIATWANEFPPGSYALGVLAWYGVGRFWLEPLRAQIDVVGDRVRINQLVAALLAMIAGALLLTRL
jgi:phosphatidylglycerol---prolipoprotein diacylglyceryl transferase